MTFALLLVALNMVLCAFNVWLGARNLRRARRLMELLRQGEGVILAMRLRSTLDTMGDLSDDRPQQQPGRNQVGWH